MSFFYYFKDQYAEGMYGRELNGLKKKNAYLIDFEGLAALEFFVHIFLCIMKTLPP